MYLSFRFDSNSLFAIDCQKVGRILKQTEIFPVPRQKSFVLGLVRHQGILVPVFDLRRLIPEPGSETPCLSHLILFYGAESLNAFPAEAIENFSGELSRKERHLPVEFLEPYDLIYNGIRYARLNFAAIEQYLNIP